MIPSRQLAAHPGQVLSEVEREGAIVITRDGRPRSIMVATSDASLVEDVAELVFARARRALAAIRRQAARTGAQALTAGEIDAEIAAVRRDRRRSSRG